MGGILAVAGIEGFLENLDDMMAASDSEGAMWRGFISSWWDCFGTAEIGTSDIFELATACEPPLSLGGGNDRSQRTRLGKLLGRMRDRVFALDGRNARIEATGTYQGVNRWKLNADEKIGKNLVDVVDVGGRCNSNVHEDNRLNQLGNSNSRGRRGRFANANAYTDAHTPAPAPVEENPGKRPPRPPRPPEHANPRVTDGGRSGERQNERPRILNPPAWLEDVP